MIYLQVLVMMVAVSAADTTTPGFVKEDEAAKCDALWNELNDPNNKISEEAYFQEIKKVEECDREVKQALRESKGYDPRSEWYGEE